MVLALPATICKHTRVTESVRVLHRLKLVDGLGQVRRHEIGSPLRGDLEKRRCCSAVMIPCEMRKTNPRRQDSRHKISPMVTVVIGIPKKLCVFI